MWTKSSKCESTHCVEVAGRDCAGTVALVRDSKLVTDDGINTSPVLTFDARSWRQFIGWVSRG